MSRAFSFQASLIFTFPETQLMLKLWRHVESATAQCATALVVSGICLQIFTQTFSIKIKTAREKSEECKWGFYFLDMLTECRNALHAFSQIPKRKFSEYPKSSLYLQVQHLMCVRLCYLQVRNTSSLDGVYPKIVLCPD